MKPRTKLVRDYIVNGIWRVMFALGMALPYAWRVRAMGWIASRLFAPMAGYPARIRSNLALVCPELPEDEVARIVRDVPDNATRTLVEIFSGAAFMDRAARAPVIGAQWLDEIEAAQAAGRPVMLVSGHYGNYDVVRAFFARRGHAIGGLYNPMSNTFFNQHYVAAISRISRPVFPRGRHGMGQMLRFLKAGGMLGILIDQHMAHGAPLQFFGRRALTALSAAEMALKYDALVVPVYGRRLPDGLNFELIFEAPIPHSTPEIMTQALNDSLEAQVRADMKQWLWIHRRWRGQTPA
jgi:KDO2-lipid IV(A) lauroyltransferase